MAPWTFKGSRCHKVVGKYYRFIVNWSLSSLRITRSLGIVVQHIMSLLGETRAPNRVTIWQLAALIPTQLAAKASCESTLHGSSAWASSHPVEKSLWSFWPFLNLACPTPVVAGFSFSLCWAFATYVRPSIWKPNVNNSWRFGSLFGDYFKMIF